MLLPCITTNKQTNSMTSFGNGSGALFEWSVTNTFYSNVISTTGIASHAVVFRGVVSPYSQQNDCVGGYHRKGLVLLDDPAQWAFHSRLITTLLPCNKQ